MERIRITILGSGNVATHLAPALDDTDPLAQVSQIYSRRLDNAKALASKINGCTACDSITDIDPESDIYIISVKDDAVQAVADDLNRHLVELGRTDYIIAHTSGSVPMSTLGNAQRKAVIYPLQTFTKGADINMSDVPFFLETSTPDTMHTVKSLISGVSSYIYEADSDRRQKLHTAAVFGCNFVNCMFDIASDILAEAGYPFEVLRPLIQATVDKTRSMSPRQGQTGPASRGDIAVINRHLASLPDDLKPIYRLLSDEIMKRQGI